MNCPKCQAPVEPGDRFCAGCGNALVARCVGCGVELAAGARFCKACGVPQPAAQAGGPRATSAGEPGLLGYCAGSGRAIRVTDEHFRCLQCEQVFLEAYRFEDKPVCQQCAYTSGMAQKLETERAETARIEAERARIEAEQRVRIEAEQGAEETRGAFEQETGFRDNGDGTVTQLHTGLQWMRCSLGQFWDGETCSGKPDKVSWDDAHAAAEALNRRGGYAGHRDWRLPTKDELSGIVYCSHGREGFDEHGMGGDCRKGPNRQSPTIHLRVFPNTPQFYFWSGSPDDEVSSHAWFVCFITGSDLETFRNSNLYVRLVRGGR